MTFQIFATAFIVLTMVLVFIAPTQYGIWSKYEVRPAEAPFDLLFVQHFYVFGIRWQKQWFGAEVDNKRVGFWVVWYDAKGRPVRKDRAEWLTRLAREALK